MSHLSSIELEEGKIGLTGDPVEAEDAVYDAPPDSDQTVCDELARLRQPRTRGSELPPDHVYHVVLIVFLLQSHVLILTAQHKVGSSNTSYIQHVRVCFTTLTIEFNPYLTMKTRQDNPEQDRQQQ